MVTSIDWTAAAQVVLDWRGPGHWARMERPCRVCGRATFLRDESGRPCNKTCAESELAAELLAATRNAEPLTTTQKGVAR